MRKNFYCLVATIAVLFAIAVGGMFLIAPVWQPNYHTVEYRVVSAESDADDETKGTSTQAAEPVELNTATEEQLMHLSGVGEAKAAAIIAYRLQNGGFSDVTELAQVPGISRQMVEDWAGQIYIAQGGD